MNRRNFSRALAIAPWSAAAWAQQSRPIRIIVPFPPGGSTDVIAREVADAMARILGAVITVENRAGAGGSIGTAEVARSAADGTTLGLATQSTHAVNPVVYKKLPYDPQKDFSLIGEIAQAPGVLLVKESLPVKDLAGFIAYVRARNGDVSYGSPGNGTIGHVWGEQFKQATNIQMLHIPYRGASQLMTDLLGGLIDATFTTVTSGLSYIQGGKLRALAVSWPKRLPMLPNVPTYAEAGLTSSNEPTWFGLVGPAGLPAATLQPLQQALAKALRQPELQQKYLGQAVFASTRNVEAFRDTIRRDTERTREISRIAKISLD